jgi:hypothetical protein
MGNDGPHFLAIRRRIFDLAGWDDRCLRRRKRSEKADSHDAHKQADEFFHETSLHALAPAKRIPSD